MSRSAFGYVTPSSTRGNFGKLTQVDAEHEDEVVGDDTLLEVGSRLADLQELVELRSVVGSDTWSSSDGACAGAWPIGYGPSRGSRSASAAGGVGYRRAMSPATPVAAGGPASPPYRAAQTRIINVALDLFTKHGVGGTSLQMIADTLGVTKAAVYHQFKTKDEIVLAAAEAELARVETAIEAAEAEPDPTRARVRC